MWHGAIEAGASATFPQQAMAARGAHQPHFPTVLAPESLTPPGWHLEDKGGGDMGARGPGGLGTSTTFDQQRSPLGLGTGGTWGAMWARVHQPLFFSTAHL